MERPTSGPPGARSLVVVDLNPSGAVPTSQKGTTILAAAQSVGVELQAICGGAGTCGGCRVRLAHGALGDPTQEELRELSAGEIAAGLRMACQATALGDVRVDIPPESLTAAQRVQLEGGEEPISAGPSRLVRLGLAIDIGTTKLAVYLLDLESGSTVARAGAMNPQIAYGEDLISRIATRTAAPRGAGTAGEARGPAQPPDRGDVQAGRRFPRPDP